MNFDVDVWVLVIGGGALALIAVLWILAEVYIRNPEAIHRARVKAWERAERERVGPEIFYGEASRSVQRSAAAAMPSGGEQIRAEVLEPKPARHRTGA